MKPLRLPNELTFLGERYLVERSGRATKLRSIESPPDWNPLDWNPADDLVITSKEMDK